MNVRRRSCRRLLLATVVAVTSSVALAGGAYASGTGLENANQRSLSAAAADDRLLPPTTKPLGTFAGVPYVQYDGLFEGQTSTGAFRVPYRITAPQDPEQANRTVLVEPPHFASGLGALNLYLRPDFLFARGFAHAGVGWSTASFGPGLDQRILDPSAASVFIQGGYEDNGGRTDPEIIVDFARALGGDPLAGSMLGRVARRYLTGFSDSSYPVMALVTSGAARGVFDFALPFVTEGDDPQPALERGLYRGKLIIVDSEADAAANLVDRAVVPNRYRFYAVAGTPHIPDFLEIPFFSSGSTPATYHPALRAHFLQGDRWVRSGSPPPPSYQLQTTGDNQIDRDENGNAIAVNGSGQPVPRLPFLELGEARFISGFLGSYDNVKTITELGFTSHAQYLKAFTDRLSDYLAAGYIGREDVAAMRTRAGVCPPLTYTETYRDHYENFVSIRSCPN